MPPRVEGNKLQIGADRTHAAFRVVMALDSLQWKSNPASGPKLSQLKDAPLPEGFAETWAQIALEAEFFYFGELIKMGPEVFEGFIKNFDAQANPVPVFTDHFVGEAAGWVRQLDDRGPDGLWALIGFTADTADAVRAGKWGFTSMGFTLQGVSRETGIGIGPELFELSLTNLPFIDGQQPLQLSRGGNKIVALNAQAAIDKAIEDGASLDELLAALQSAAEKEGTEIMADTDLSVLLAEAAGLEPDAIASAIKENMDGVVAALKGEAPAPPPETATMNRALELKVAALEESNNKLSARLDERDGKDLEAEVDTLIELGKVLPAARAEVIEMMRRDPETARKVFGAQQVVPTGMTEPDSPESAGSKSGTERADADPALRAAYEALSPGNQAVVDMFAPTRGFAWAMQNVQKVVSRRATAN